MHARREPVGATTDGALRPELLRCPSRAGRPSGVRASFLGWSDDGSAFYLATPDRDPRHFDLYRYAADGYARERIFENSVGYALAAASGNGRWLALGRPRTSADSDLFIADLAGEAVPKLITPHEGTSSWALGEKKKLPWSPEPAIS